MRQAGSRAAVLLVLSVLVFSSAGAAGVGSSGDPGDSDMVLFDYGDGSTVWTEAQIRAGDTVDTMLRRTAASSGVGYASSEGTITVDGITSSTIGGSSEGGSFVDSGTTGVTVSCGWRVYLWSEASGSWSEAGSIYGECTPGSYALGFYPEGITPVETPDCQDSWVMVRGDSAQSGAQTVGERSEEEAAVRWTDTRGGVSGVCSAVLSAQDRVFVKFGTSSGMSSQSTVAALRCYTMDGELQWSFEFPGILYFETSTPLIVGDSIYVPSGCGYVFKIPWKVGPGEDNENVTTFGGAPYNSLDIESGEGSIPLDTGAELTGTTYSTGPASPVYSSGGVYLMSSNGMVYCFDTDLNLVWSYQLGGHTYYLSPTVTDGYVFCGALDGCLYVLDGSSGDLVDMDKVYTRTIRDKEYGLVSAPSVISNGSGLILMFSVSDGRGMNSLVGGVSIYTFEGGSLERRYLNTEDFGIVSNYMVAVSNEGFEGAYFAASGGLYRISSAGSASLMNGSIEEVHAAPVLVDGERIYLAAYGSRSENYVSDLEGNILSVFERPSNVDNYNMSPVTVIGSWTFVGNDSGMYAIYGSFPESVPGGGFPLWILAAAVALIVAGLYLAMKYVLRIECPLGFIRQNLRAYTHPGEGSHNAKSKRRLVLVLAAGSAIAFGIFTASLSVGSTAVFSFTDTYSILFSAISKGGQDLTEPEILVYYSRLPRTMAAFAVGIGLSVAGAVYQAIIRNPLVDPYIMGVSSGAGTAAIAVIAFDFTFFGIFAPNDMYLTAFAAIAGGLIAFFATMFIAERAGGSSVNYVLAGVVVGLAFSAVQTLMLSMAGHQVTGALSWLFGSFSNISWSQVWVVLVPALFLSLVPLVWAKELNLVLLGEDQAMQMGLNVRRFNRFMLILASVLTAICVAFVGIIGFVGLVIPHLCRMILGGDHRLVLPASIVLGSALMMLADFASRTMMTGIELPVGAITTVIGVPVFAYLLVRRGKMYDG